MNAHRAVRGWTLVELIAVMAMAAILVALALPSFGKMLTRRHLEGVAAQVSADLQYLRSEAVARNALVQIGFHEAAGGTCYVIHTTGTSPGGGDCRCNGTDTPSCSPGVRMLRSVVFPADSPVQVRANVPAMRVDPRHGTVSPSGTVRIALQDGGQVQHVVSILGRVRTCSNDVALPGMARCAR